MSAQTRIELRSELSEIERLSAAIEAFGEQHGLAADVVFNLNLALEEIVTNVISYAFEDGGTQHPVLVTMTLEGGVVTAVVEDGGKPFDPLQKEDPDVTAGIDERGVGGLGVLLTRKLMDEVNYSRTGDRNILRMAKRISTGGAVV